MVLFVHPLTIYDADQCGWLWAPGRGHPLDTQLSSGGIVVIILLYIHRTLYILYIRIIPSTFTSPWTICYGPEGESVTDIYNIHYTYPIYTICYHLDDCGSCVYMYLLPGLESRILLDGSFSALHPSYLFSIHPNITLVLAG